MTGAATRRPTVTGSLPLTLRTPPGVAEPIPPRDGRPGIPPGLLFLLVLTPLLGVYVWFHFRAFGALTPYAVNLVYAGNTDLELVARHFEVVDRLYRLAGLWVDGEFGLVRWAPVLLLALPGIPLLFARATPGHLLLPALIATQWCMAVFFSITMRGWWFPGRMMIAVLPLLAVPLALAFCRHPQRLRVPAAGLGLLTLGATLTLWAETRSEAIVLAVDPFALQWPLFRLTAPLFPVYTEYTPSTWLLTGLWVLVAAALLIYGARCGRTPPGDGAVAGPPSDTSRVPMVASR